MPDHLKPAQVGPHPIRVNNVHPDGQRRDHHHHQQQQDSPSKGQQQRRKKPSTFAHNPELEKKEIEDFSKLLKGQH